MYDDRDGAPEWYPEGSGFGLEIGDEVELRLGGKSLTLEITRALPDNIFFGRALDVPDTVARTRLRIAAGRLLRFHAGAVFVRRRPDPAPDGPDAAAA